jgi:hypothetical protein
MCAGMNLARIEMDALSEALVEAQVELTAEIAEPGNNAGLFRLSRLPFRLDPIKSGLH